MFGSAFFRGTSMCVMNWIVCVNIYVYGLQQQHHVGIYMCMVYSNSIT
jgi:hypothetical protein